MTQRDSDPWWMQMLPSFAVLTSEQIRQAAETLQKMAEDERKNAVCRGCGAKAGLTEYVLIPKRPNDVFGRAWFCPECVE